MLYIIDKFCHENTLKRNSFFNADAYLSKTLPT